jgi:GH35 family endo-1,4-beta-xylanase
MDASGERDAGRVAHSRLMRGTIVAVLVLLLGACGRLGFDSVPSDGGSDTGHSSTSEVGSADAVPEDSRPAEAGAADAGLTEAGATEAGAADAGAADAGLTEAGAADAGATEAGAADAGADDVGANDVGAAEAGAADAATVAWQRPASLPEPNPGLDTLRAHAAPLGLYVAGMTDTLGGSGWTDPAIQTIEGAEFNAMVPGNELKWWMIHPQRNTYDFGPADGLVDFAVAHAMKVRGTNLVWGQYNPDWLGNDGASSYTLFTGAELETILVDHIQTVMGHFCDKYPGVVKWWDVTNNVMGWDDTFNSDGIMWTLIGTNPDRADYLRVAFQTARATDPAAVLCMNDAANEGSNPTRAQNMISTVQAFRAEGIPIDCVGMEAHLSTTSYPSYDTVLAVMQQYAAMGVQVQVTEFDVVGPNTLDWTTTATVATSLLKACRDSPNCTLFNNWGISQKYLLHDWGASQSTMLLWDVNNAKSPEYTAERTVLVAP